MKVSSIMRSTLASTLFAGAFLACHSGHDVQTVTEFKAAPTTINARTSGASGNIFGDVVPAVGTWPDNQAVTVGVKVKSSIDGNISGIRLYRGVWPDATTLTVTLWTESGVALASGTLSLPNGVSQPGWFEVPFTQANGAPVNVPIKAGTTYIASYFTPIGYYAAANNALENDVVTSNAFGGTLTALGGLANGGNGVYAYGPANQFPNLSFRNTNYYVDVMFSTYANVLGTTAASTAVWPDNQAVTVGAKVSSSVNGRIWGVRVYRGVTGPVTLTGTLWSTAGVALAEGTLDFPNGVTEAGWYEIPFKAADGSPVSVPVTANTTYVASYFTPIGGYAAENFFHNNDITTANPYGGALTIPGGLTSGGNGVYAYGPASQFPNLSFRNSTYYVDVLFDQP